ncbi:hypothetical protein B566_EDAN008059 [Ephemera danica]|nr:hypothetical protein B566_EDAN008059 [Ephemera danica]
MVMELNWTTAAAAACGAGCDIPPPDSILLIPPPPLPTFLQLAPLQLLQSNLSDDHEDQMHVVPPCGPHCDWSAAPGVEFVELPRQALDDAWFLILVGSSVAVLLLGALLAFVLLKCRDQGRKSQVDGAGGCRAGAKFRHAKPLAANLPPPLGAGLGAGLGVGLGPGPCYAQGHNPHVLWAAITHKGTPAHFAVPGVKTPHADYYRPPPGLGYYGALDPRFPTPPPPSKSEPGTPDSQIYAEIPEIKPEKMTSFENSAFEDFMMYEPTEAFPLAEVTPPTLRRGHSGTLTRLHGRPLVGPPTNIESPNLPPLNLRGRNPLLV